MRRHYILNIYKSFLFSIIIIILFVMITGNLTIIFFLSILLISNVSAAPCESCENCQIINVKKQCLKCVQGYHLNGIRGRCVPLQPPSYQLRRIVSITFNDEPNVEQTTVKSESASTSAAKKMNPDTSKSLRNQNQLNIRFPQNKNTLSNLIISRFYDFPYNYQQKSSSLTNPFTVDLYCRRYQGRICQQCQHRYFLQSGKCKKIGIGCESWNEVGQCLTCYLGFALNQKGQCIFDAALYYPAVTKSQKDVNSTLTNNQSASSNSQMASLPNCIQNDKAGTCLKCAFRFYLKDGICYRVSDLCREWSDDTGACTSCYQNYILSGTSCVFSAQVQNAEATTSNASAPRSAPIANCADFGPDGSCTKCAYRHYKINSMCQPIHGDCQSWSTETGGCTQCYSQFQLKDSKCIKKSQPETKPMIFVPPSMKGCSEYSQEGICRKCALRFVLVNGACKNVIDQCKSWELANGDCKQCYEGYKLIGVGCQKSNETSFKEQIPLIAQKATVQQALTIDDIIAPKNETQDEQQKKTEQGIDIGQVIFQKRISETLK